MHPEICRLGPLTIYSYGLMLAIAFMISTFLASAEAKRRGINPDIIFNLCFIIFISGIIGARIFYVAQNISYYRLHLPEIVMLQKGGLSLFGGLILGIPIGIFYLRLKKLAVYKFADLLVPFVALAQALGRLGCFLNGCCFGKESSFGIYFPIHEGILIPTQLYSSLLLVIIFIILRFLQEKPHKAGTIFFTYLLLYSIKRFFIDFWRADNPAIFFGLTLFQLLSIIVFFIAFSGLFLIKRNKT